MSQTTYTDDQEQLAHFCSSIGNPTRIAILEKLGCSQSCEGNIEEIAGLSRYTVGTHLKYLKKSGLVKGSLGTRSVSYCVNYEELENLKRLFESFYNKVTANKASVNKEQSCK